MYMYYVCKYYMYARIMMYTHCIYIYTYHVSIRTHICIYIYIYTHCVCVYTYIYIYMHVALEPVVHDDVRDAADLGVVEAPQEVLY